MMRVGVLAVLVLAPLLAGCIGQPTAIHDGSASAPLVPPLPPGTRMAAASILNESATHITFRWSATAPASVTPGVRVFGLASTTLTLPPGALLDVLTERAAVRGTDLLETKLVDPQGYSRCSGRGPGLGPEWREVCHVRPVGPLAQHATWAVRVENHGTSPASFTLDVTVRIVPAQTMAALQDMVPLEATAKDGVKLRGHVYLPEGPGPFGTVLVFMPYWNHGGSVASNGLAITLDGRRGLAAYGAFLQAGFAVAAVNSRGSGISDGCYEYMNHPKNGQDANAVVDAIAAQPWSNGRVGMYGVSYAAATQFAAIAHDPSRHLRAVIPVSGEWDEWNFMGIWGAAYDGAASHPTRRNFEQGMGGAGMIAAAESQRVAMPTPLHWCQDTAMSQWNWDQLILNGDKNEWFRKLDLRQGIERSSVPFFLTNGLTDGEGSHRSTPYDLWDLVHAPQRWTLAQSGHGTPGFDTIAFWWDYAIPWFDHYLRDGPALDTELVDYQDDSRRWNRAERWPPPGTQTELFLSEGKLVADRASVRASEQRAANRDTAIAGPTDCGLAAIYVSEPLARETLIAGEFRANFTATSTTPNGNVAAYLYRTKNVPTCGTPVAPGDSGVLLRYALSDLRHRGHLEQGTDATPGAAVAMSTRSYPLAARVPAGERLVLVIGAGHPDLFAKPYQPFLSVTTGPQIEGRLVLNVVDESPAR
ncbi:MAG TPA: CocE/NonD family hydrolase [Candidatus Thermoplasmatota archaeon]|nr:CocE/NonD family hydrolase [Candidatus Thermoplasmatota archaeon]